MLTAADAFTGSVLARHADGLREQLRAPECERFVFRAEPGAAPSLRCLVGSEAVPGPAAALLHARGAGLVASYRPTSEDGAADDLEPAWLATLSVAEDGGVEIALEVSQLAAGGIVSLLIPGTAPAGPSQLSQQDVLVHARVRPEAGIDLSALTAAGGQGDQMFGLRDRLFSRAVLGGAWELAAYLPRAAGRDAEPSTMAGLALAVELANREAASLAIAGFVAKLEGTWPIRRSAFAAEQLPEAWRDAFEAACFLDLQILPELAPCWVAREGSLVVAWNRPTLLHALGERAAMGGDSAQHGWVAHLDRFAEADERLREVLAPDALPIGVHYPWARLRVEGRAADAGDRLAQSERLRVALEAHPRTLAAAAPEGSTP